MNKSDQLLIVRHSYASDPNPAKVQAALDQWRRALAHRMMHVKQPGPLEEQAASVQSGNEG
jgi:hypothetical protein